MDNPLGRARRFAVCFCGRTVVFDCEHCGYSTPRVRANAARRREVQRREAERQDAGKVVDLAAHRVARRR